MSKIVFMGDSISEYIPYIYKGDVANNEYEIRYCGFGNIGVGSYMNYIWPNIVRDDVDTYILLIGINNICRPDCDYDNRETLDELVDKLKEFINKISNETNSKLIVQSIYPTNMIDINEKVLYVNDLIKNYCNSLNIQYLNLYNILEDENGLFNKDYTYDGIHPNELGYEIIISELDKFLIINSNKKLIKK